MLVYARLSGSINMDDEISIYSRFRVEASDFGVSHLQYAYDILIVEVPTLKNIWSIKAFLGGFKLALRLWVNFFIGILLGFNVGHVCLTFHVNSFLLRLKPFLLGTFFLSVGLFL